MRILIFLLIKIKIIIDTITNLHKLLSVNRFSLKTI